ncbi:acyltransferase [Maribellus maritimus]|uniref:acyltransferase n=1 Tax=Maribellus maritimus TaxID=2870838 RepID=UPI001EE9BEDB|nr:acyltransferase [Maribellus maritimus]MCG6190242.1 acyltransferase [Maribellus maritimus]
MQKLVTYAYKAVRRILIGFWLLLCKPVTWFIFYGNNIRFGKFSTSGIPFVSVAFGGECSIDDNLKMNNGNIGNPIGRPQRCVLFVDKGAKLEIGKNVGISSAAIVAYKHISIGNNVKIGGGVCIYDSDFHSIDASIRNNPEKDLVQKNNKPVVIGDNVFIGAHSLLLKGITIGENSIIGASSVVTKNIPPNEIWAGNPAVFIKSI